jgi:hypothetical protein
MQKKKKKHAVFKGSRHFDKKNMWWVWLKGLIENLWTLVGEIVILSWDERLVWGLSNKNGTSLLAFDHGSTNIK